MSRASRVRVPVTEHLASAEVIPTLVEAGMTSTEAVAVLARNSARLRRSLRLPDGDGPLVVDGEFVKAVDVAGVVRLAPGIELDIAPKFLGFEHPTWREDLLAISNYTQRGRIISRNVAAGIGHAGDLASLIGRVFVGEFWRHYRKPLRVYRERRWHDFSLDGDLDADLLHEQSPDGFPQRAMVLDRRNPYNAVIARATDVLIGDVRDSAVRAQLLRVRGFLGAQDEPPRHLRPVPPRHEQWADLVELSRNVALGADLTLRADRFEAPGYVVRTWEAWERLVYIAIRGQLGFDLVKPQLPYTWGTRGGEDIVVKPDVTIVRGDGRRLVDAKYKTRLERSRQRISQSDLMEAAAFMAAGGADQIVLLYPRPARPAGTGEPRPCGVTRVFDCATVTPGHRVIGVDVEVRGFSMPNAHRQFGARLVAALDVAFESENLDLGELGSPLD
jgi:5-methylcytosine-specific restriction enzyme subunit McrC